MTIPKNQWPDSDEWRDLILSKWDAVYGDRRQEIVFIGTPEMDDTALRAALDACLVPELDLERFDPLLFAHLADPFPAWANGEMADA